MSDAVSALNGASYSGYAQVSEAPLTGMITLRGDLGSAAVKSAIKAATGAAIPGQRQINVKAESAVAWMSPDELLVIVPYDTVATSLQTLCAGLDGEHALVVNVSDARAMFTVSGAGAREVIAKLCPVDMAPGAFAPGQIRRTRMAQIPAAFWMQADESLQVVCFRSVADYVFNLLSSSALPQSEVGVF